MTLKPGALYLLRGGGLFRCESRSITCHAVWKFRDPEGTDQVPIFVTWAEETSVVRELGKADAGWLRNRIADAESRGLKTTAREALLVLREVLNT